VWVDIERENVVRLEPKIDAPEVAQGLREQQRRNHQRERCCDLDDRERTAQLPATARPGSCRFLQVRQEVAPLAAPCGDEAEQQPSADRHTDREGQYTLVERNSFHGRVAQQLLPLKDAAQDQCDKNSACATKCPERHALDHMLTKQSRRGRAKRSAHRELRATAEPAEQQKVRGIRAGQHENE
jgi:hypothetical protein